MPRAKVLLADRGYDADWFRNTLIDKDITPCIPSSKNRKVQIERKRRLRPIDFSLAVGGFCGGTWADELIGESRTRSL